jgi:hypothetical protein
MPGLNSFHHSVGTDNSQDAIVQDFPQAKAVVSSS